MNPGLDGLSFTGNVFLIDSNGNAVSPLTAVPEPTTAGIVFGGIALMLLLRRRR
jgi:hypothetical protein